MSSSYTFKWEHPGSEVYVTGDFDGWKKTEKLEKTAAGHFEKTVVIPSSDTRHEYKFFVDGEWKYNPSLPTESDGAGNVNNVLHNHDLVPTAGFAALSSAAPTSTTAALAGQVPKESSHHEEIPGAFPETPGFATPMTESNAFSVNPIPASSGIGNPIKLAAGEPVPDSKAISSTGEEAAYGVNPIPASSGIGNPIKLTPGEPVPDSKTISSTGEESAYGVKPIPASAGIGNPIQLAPGESVPHSSTIGDHTVGSTVKTDKASYENSDAVGAAALGAGALGAGGLAAGSGMFGVPPVTSGMIPESSLPMGSSAAADIDAGPFMQSAHPESSTAALAGAVPLEPRGVPSEVVESQKEAHVSPEASANPTAVADKKEVEAELLHKVHETPATDEKAAGGLSAGGIAAAVGGAAAAAGAAAAGVAAATYSKLPTGVQQSIDDINNKATAATTGTSTTGTSSTPAAAVPETVTDSIAAAHTSPEAAANPTAVAEKSAMESELASKVSPVTSAGEPAPTAAAATSAVAPAATNAAPAAAVPETVADSIAAAHSSPEAAANPTAVAEKTAMEAELEKKVSPVEASSPSTQTKPVVTTGLDSSTTEPVTTGTASSTAEPASAPATPAKKNTAVADPATPASAVSATGTDASGTESAKDKKKKKRFSVFIDKIKDKLK